MKSRWIYIILGLMPFFLGDGVAFAQTPYGSCAMTAQYYQDQYQSGGRVADMVCFQTALQRELKGDSKPNGYLSGKQSQKEARPSSRQQLSASSVTNKDAIAYQVGNLLWGSPKPEYLKKQVDSAPLQKSIICYSGPLPNELTLPAQTISQARYCYINERLSYLVLDSFPIAAAEKALRDVAIKNLGNPSFTSSSLISWSAASSDGLINASFHKTALEADTPVRSSSLVIASEPVRVLNSRPKDDSMVTPLGKLKISEDKVLLLDGKPIKPRVQGNVLLDVSKQFSFRKNQAFLIEDIGGTACPAVYRWIIVSSQGYVVSPSFGTCSDLIETSVDGEKLLAVMPGFVGPFEPVSKHKKAVKQKFTYLYDGKLLTENGNPVSEPR